MRIEGEVSAIRVLERVESPVEEELVDDDDIRVLEGMEGPVEEELVDDDDIRYLEGMEGPVEEELVDDDDIRDLEGMEGPVEEEFVDEEDIQILDAVCGRDVAREEAIPEFEYLAIQDSNGNGGKAANRNRFTSGIEGTQFPKGCSTVEWPAHDILTFQPFIVLKSQKDVNVVSCLLFSFFFFFLQAEHGTFQAALGVKQLAAAPTATSFPSDNPFVILVLEPDNPDAGLEFRKRIDKALSLGKCVLVKGGKPPIIEDFSTKSLQSVDILVRTRIAPHGTISFRLVSCISLTPSYQMPRNV
jgi:hypothetical protein